MTDAEVICTFMEPKPALPSAWYGQYNSPGRWWTIGPIDGGGMRWFPCRNGSVLTLGSLWEVEERLTDEQWVQYLDLLAGRKMYYFRKILDYADVKAWVHATPTQKITALATILRPIVENSAEVKG